MTDKTINFYINKLNRGWNPNLVFKRTLTPTVDYAIIWKKQPKSTDEVVYNRRGYSFYLIKNENDIYVGAVLDMVSDLHWFVSKRNRGMGYLTNAMKSVVLPHLFQKRKRQRITINETLDSKMFKASQKVALALGFKKINQSEYILNGKNYKGIITPNQDICILSEERMLQLTKQINYIEYSFRMIQNEIQMKLGDQKYADELLKLTEKLGKQKMLLEDKFYTKRRI